MKQTTQSGSEKISVKDGGIVVDKSNNRLVVYNEDGSKVVIGSTPDGFGVAYHDDDGTLLKTETGIRAVRYRGDGSAYYVSGTLPDGTQGDVYAREGEDVFDAFS